MNTAEERKFSRHWDAGDIGCGSLIIGLKRELGRVGPGELLLVTAHNGGAFVDIPAWCRMTGHALVSSNHPSYVLRKKGTHSSIQ
jgi:tRNA 2-thiouridine synthesizing protein A